MIEALSSLLPTLLATPEVAAPSWLSQALEVAASFFDPDQRWMLIILACVLCSALAAGALSPMVVNNRMAFFSDAMAHATLAGAALGMMYEIDLTLAMVIWALLLALLLSRLKRSKSVSVDTALGLIMAGSLALGTILYKVSVKGYSGFHHLLFGQIAFLNMSDLAVSAIAAGVALLTALMGMNFALRLGVSREMEEGEGKRVATWDLIFLCALAFVVSVLVQPLGVLMINAYVILPAATSTLIARSHAQMFWGAIFFALLSAFVGLVLSHVADWPPGPSLVCVLIACFGLAALVRTLRAALQR